MESLFILMIADHTIVDLGIKQQFEKWGFQRIEVVDHVQNALQSIQRQSPSLVFVQDNLNTQWEAFEMGLLIRNLQSTPIIFLSTSVYGDGQQLWLLLLIDKKDPLSLPYTEKALQNIVEIALDLNLPSRGNV